MRQRGECARVNTLTLPREAPAGAARTYLEADLALGRYKLLEQLGSGGYGTVWIARDQQVGDLVAVKRIPRRPGDPQERARIEREGRAAAMLSHPAIVALFDTGEDDVAHYLVSELVEGESLAAHYRRGGLGDRALMAIGSALAEALEHAHDCGIVHRDVKPQNVIVPADPEAGEAPAKLTDFGIARLTGEHPLTITGDIIGTFEYMAPEQAHGRTAGPQADLYSLALTLYEGFAGANPLRGQTVAATALRLGNTIEPLSNRRRDLAPALCAAIDRALAPDPANRGTLAELRSALDDARSPRRRLLPARSRRPQPRTIELTPRARMLIAAASAGAASGATLTTLLGVHSLQSGLIAGAAVAAAVALSSAVGWLLVGLGALAWLGLSGDPGTALVLFVALAPVPILLPTRPWLWSAAALAPALGLIGLAACTPVFAGRLGARAATRAALGALSYWWLAIAETLSGQRLLFGAPASVLPRSSWQGSLQGAFNHAIVPLCSDGRLATALVWALAAVVLPWLVRRSRGRFRMFGTLLWAGALLVGGAVVAGRLGLPRPPSPLAAAVLGGVLAFVSANVRADSHRTPTVA